jgi:hypothetical protein
MNDENGNKWIVVFLKNKLISLDSILPLALEMNQCCNYKFYFIIWQYESYKSVVKDNIVMRDMALSIGQIVCPSRPNKSTLNNKINKFVMLANVLFKLFSKKSYVFHFGGLDEKPMMLLTKLIKKNKIARCESSISGRYTKDFQQGLESGLRIDEKTIYQHRSSQEILDKYRGAKYPMNKSGILIGFDPDWNWFKYPDANSCKKLVFDVNNDAKNYYNFISKNSDHYLTQEKLIDLEGNKTIIIILGHYGDGGSEYRNKLLSDALVVLRDLNLNIVMKPHIFCDMDLVKSIVKDSKCVDSKIYYTKLHPKVLKKVSFAGLFVNNSTVRCDYKLAGFPFIQYNGGMVDKVRIDSCSDVVCSTQNQLNSSLKLLMKGFDSNLSKEKRRREGNTDICSTIREVFDCTDV